jgi:hypothetical protein
LFRATHVFDVGAGVNGDDVAVLDAEVVADNAVDAGLTILEIVVGENNQDSVLALLSLDQDSDTGRDVSIAVTMQNDGGAYMSELGFFFFLRIAVDTSFSTWEASQLCRSWE